jgi:hypothetical protein
MMIEMFNDQKQPLKRKERQNSHIPSAFKTEISQAPKKAQICLLPRRSSCMLNFRFPEILISNRTFPSGYIIRIQATLCHYTIHLALLGEFPTILTTLCDIHKTNGDHRSCTDSEQKWEAHPIITGVVNDCLYDIGTDD